jgi:hypothetical protein
MLRMAGVQAHPAVRILIGGVLIALGIARHDAVPALVVGTVLIVWGFAAVLALAGGRRNADSQER